MGTQNRPLVWLVDDAELVRGSLAAVLEAADFAVQAFASAPAFLAGFTTGARGTLVVDQHMPEMTGLELLQQLGKRGAIPTAILISGQGNAELEQRALAAGAVAMLSKPVDGDELIALIDRLVLNAR